MIDTIHRVLQYDRTSEKSVLNLDVASARYVLRELMQREKGIVNLRFESMLSFVSRVVGFKVIEMGGRYLREGEGLLIMQALVNPAGHFAAALEMPGFMHALVKTVEQLRLAEVKPEQLNLQNVGSEQKASELADLMKRYADFLKQHKLFDYPRALLTAIFERSLQFQDGIVFLPGNSALQPLERKFIDQAGSKLISLPFNMPDKMPVSRFWSADLLNSTRKEEECLPSDCRLDFFSATDPQAEIRQMLRVIRAAGVPFEQVVIALAAPKKYHALLTSHLDVAGIPFASDLRRDLNEYRPGRLAFNLCEWADNGFPVENLISMLNQGDLCLFPSTARKAGKKSIRISSQKVISLLRLARIRGGREGYEQPLLALGNGESPAKDNPLRIYSRKLAAKLKRLIAKFPEEVAPGRMAANMGQIVSAMTRISDSNDARRLAALKRILSTLADVKEPMLKLSRAMYWLKLVLSQSSANETFRPDGRLLVTSVNAAGLCNRQLIFFPGLSHSAIPGFVATDPVLSENCRALFSALKTAEDDRLERYGNLYCAWASLPATSRVVLSMPLADENGRANSPSAPLIKALRQKLNRDIEFSKLVASADMPLYGQLGDSKHEPLDFREWLWYQEKAGVCLAELRNLFEQTHRHWARYKYSQAKRRDNDSMLQTGLKPWNPGKWQFHDNPQRAISPSRINKYSGCRYAVFLSDILHCMPADLLETQISSSGWLNAMERGNLLHKIYELFMRRITWPVEDCHKDILSQVVAEVVEEFRVQIPPPSHAVFMVEKAAIERDALFFFELESSISQKNSQPLGFEVKFGLPEDDSRKNSLDNPEPIAFTLSDGRNLYFRGRIDRIDETPQGLQIWDYKTGSADKHKPGGELAAESSLQLALYKYVVAKILKLRDDNREIFASGLYFPTVGGQGEKVLMTSRDEEKILSERLEHLFDFFATGQFPASDNCDSCNALNICPYASVFRDSGTDTDSRSASEEE